MNRRRFVGKLQAVSVPLDVVAQQMAKMSRIGVAVANPIPSPVWLAVLADAGCVEASIVSNGVMPGWHRAPARSCG
jgi:hypothetical protein